VRIRKIALQGAYVRICVSESRICERVERIRIRTTGFPVLSTGSTALKYDQIHLLPIST
jgi:hypothetical protein